MKNFNKNMKIKIGEKLIGDKCPVFVIAEAGINHNGDIEKAMLLIDEAVKCGADAVKFQTHLPEQEMLKDAFTADYVGDSLFDILKKVELSKEDHIKLKEHAEEKGILFLSTPFSREAADLLEEINVKAYKVGSGEMTNLPLIEHIAKKGKPMFISTGMSTFEEIRETVDLVKKLNNNFIILHCTSSYPTKYEDVNLKVIEQLKGEFKTPVGLSDHSLGIYTSLAAVVLGACVLEKHFTISREWPGPDQKASIEPRELSDLVQGVKAIKKALGGIKRINEDEVPVKEMARESVVSLVDILQGTVIEANMVWVKRPGTGIPAKELSNVIGKKAKEDIKANQLILWNDLDTQ